MIGNPSGNVLNFYCELPHTIDDVDSVGQALLELDMEITGMAEPPVAKLGSAYAPGNPTEALANEIEDYRRFYVEFENHATEADVIKAAGIVYSALKRLADTER